MSNLVKTVICRHVNGVVRQAVKTPAVYIRVRPMSSYGHDHGKPYRPSMLDDLPVPHGPWKVAYKKKQAKNNRQFIIGVSFFLFTFWFVFRSGYLFFNFYPPPLPEADEDNILCMKPVVIKCPPKEGDDSANAEEKDTEEVTEKEKEEATETPKEKEKEE